MHYEFSLVRRPIACCISGGAARGSRILRGMVSGAYQPRIRSSCSASGVSIRRSRVIRQITEMVCSALPPSAAGLACAVCSCRTFSWPACGARPVASLDPGVSRLFAAANSKVAVEQIAAYVRDHGLVNEAAVSERRAAAVTRHRRALTERKAAEQPKDGVITAEYLTACVRRLLDGEDALILTEVVTNSRIVQEHLRPNRPGISAAPWRRFAGVVGRRGRRCQARLSRTDGGFSRRRRFFPVQRAIVGAVGAASVRYPGTHGHLRQPRLGRAQVLDADGASGPGPRLAPMTSTCRWSRRLTCRGWRWPRARGSARPCPIRTSCRRC
jgi:hypothetical protein